MAKIFVHLTLGPEASTRAALAFLVADAGLPVQMATPNQLVALRLEHDRVFTY